MQNAACRKPAPVEPHGRAEARSADTSTLGFIARLVPPTCTCVGSGVLGKRARTRSKRSSHGRGTWLSGRTAPRVPSASSPAWSTRIRSIGTTGRRTVAGATVLKPREDDAVVDATQGVLYLIEIKEHVAIDALVPQVMEIIVAVWKPTVTVERDHRRARSPDSEADHRGDFEKNGGADC